MSPREWKARVQDMLDAIIRIEEYASGYTYTTFVADRKTIDAVVRNLEIIGEAARAVPIDIEARYPHVPWPEKLFKNSFPVVV